MSITETLYSRRQFRVMDDATLAPVANRHSPHYDEKLGYQNFLRARAEIKRRAAIAKAIPGELA